MDEHTSVIQRKVLILSRCSLWFGCAGMALLLASFYFFIDSAVFELLASIMLIICTLLSLGSLLVGIAAKLLKRKVASNLSPSTHENWGLAFSAVVLIVLPLVAIPNFINIRNYRATRRTGAIMRAISDSLEAYYEANGSYPAPGYSGNFNNDVLPTDNDDDRKLRTTAWGQDFFFSCSTDGETYLLVSPGCDGEFNREYTLSPLPEPKRFDDCCGDFVMVNGDFFQAYGGWCYEDLNYQRHLDIQSFKAATLTLTSDPADDNALLKKAKAELALGKHQDSVASFRQYMERNPNDLPAAALLCESLYRSGSFQESYAVCTQVIREDHAIGSAWFYRGMSNYGLGHKESSLEDVRRAAALDQRWIFEAQCELNHFEEDNFIILAFADRVLGIRPSPQLPKQMH